MKGWRELVEKVRDRLRKWDVKSISISMAGRVTVIKSIISALPVYGMSVFPLPKESQRST